MVVPLTSTRGCGGRRSSFGPPQFTFKPGRPRARLIGIVGIGIVGVVGVGVRVIGIRKAEPKKGKIGPEKTAVVPEEKLPMVAEEAAVTGKRAAVEPAIVPKREPPARAPKVVAKGRPVKTTRPHPWVASAHVTAKGFRGERQGPEGGSRQNDAKFLHDCRRDRENPGRPPDRVVYR